MILFILSLKVQYIFETFSNLNLYHPNKATPKSLWMELKVSLFWCRKSLISNHNFFIMCIFRESCEEP